MSVNSDSNRCFHAAALEEGAGGTSQTISLTSEQMNAPCVYRVLNAKRKPLYVGCGTSGMGRVFDFSPDQRGRCRAFDSCSSVGIEFFSSKEQAAQVEAAMIHQLHPKFNAFCPSCGYYSKRRPRRMQGAGVIFGKTRHQILALLLGRSEKAYYLREVARLTGLSVGLVSRELKTLTKLGVLRRRQQGKSIFYQAETESPFFHELKSMVGKGA